MSVLTQGPVGEADELNGVAVCRIRFNARSDVSHGSHDSEIRLSEGFSYCFQLCLERQHPHVLQHAPGLRMMEKSMVPLMPELDSIKFRNWSPQIDDCGAFYCFWRRACNLAGHLKNFDTVVRLM